MILCKPDSYQLPGLVFTVEIYDKADIVNGITDRPLVSGITVTFGD